MLTRDRVAYTMRGGPRWNGGQRPNGQRPERDRRSPEPSLPAGLAPTQTLNRGLVTSGPAPPFGVTQGRNKDSRSIHWRPYARHVRPRLCVPGTRVGYLAARCPAPCPAQDFMIMTCSLNRERRFQTERIDMISLHRVSITWSPSREKQ